MPLRRTVPRVWHLLPLLLAGAAFAAAEDDWPDLAELGRIEVASITRRPVMLAQAPAAVSILTSEGLLRSGARSVAEALRLVPGFMVAQIDANSWAISSRGFNSEYAGKLLVMVDGRSVYSPVLSLTYWDTQNPMIEDLERIEVIRGPGSTHWGANAVNGVVNIVSKTAQETQGSLLYTSAGWPQEIAVGARYGGRVDDHTAYRVYSLYRQSGPFPLESTGNDGADRWDFGQAGFRIDHTSSSQTQWTWQGDAYTTRTKGEATSDRGANTLGRLRHVLSETSDLELQAYYDYTERDTAFFDYSHHTLDLDFQHNWAASSVHSLLWGLGCRLGRSHYVPVSPVFISYKETLTTLLVSTFVEDEIHIIPDRLALTPGCKIEHNDMTGWELQPGIRFTYQPSASRHLWAAASHAVRTPSESESFQTISYPLASGFYLADSKTRAEKLIAYEAGYREQFGDRLAITLSAYCNDYTDLITEAPNGEILPSGLPRLTGQNLIHGQVYGGEITLDWQAAKNCRISAWYSRCQTALAAAPGGEAALLRTKHSTPANQAYARASLDLGRNCKADLQLRFVDHLDFIPSYIEADVRVAWEIGDNIEIAVTGQNLIHSRHCEFRKAAYASALASVPRSVQLKLTKRF